MRALWQHLSCRLADQQDRLMASLRRQLWCWLLPLYVIAAIVSMVATHRMYGMTVHWFMDNQLRVLADSHDGQTTPAALRSLTAANVQKGDFIVQIWSRDGRLLTTSWPALDVPLLPTPGFHTVEGRDCQWRVYSVQSPERTVQSAQSMGFRDMAIREQALQAGLPIALLIPVSAIVLWLAIKMALRRLELVASAAAIQDEHSVSELPLQHVPTEIRPLVIAINRLLQRLSEALAAQRRFVQDAAHELRTPITALNLQLENLKAHLADNPAAEQIAQLEAGVARMQRLVEQLLRLARQEAPAKPEEAAKVDLADFLKDAIVEFMPLADQRHIDLGYSAGKAGSVRANLNELRSLCHNLLDNALRYTPEGGVVDVRLQDDAGVVTVEIADTGPGIPHDLLPRVFDRFFRIEGTGTEGSGLGLAIAKHAAERNAIDLELRNRADRSGLVARVRFSPA